MSWSSERESQIEACVDPKQSSFVFVSETVFVASLARRDTAGEQPPVARHRYEQPRESPPHPHVGADSGEPEDDPTRHSPPTAGEAGQFGSGSSTLARARARQCQYAGAGLPSTAAAPGSVRPGFKTGRRTAATAAHVRRPVLDRGQHGDGCGSDARAGKR